MTSIADYGVWVYGLPLCPSPPKEGMSNKAKLSICTENDKTFIWELVCLYYNCRSPYMYGDHPLPTPINSSFGCLSFFSLQDQRVPADMVFLRTSEKSGKVQMRNQFNTVTK